MKKIFMVLAVAAAMIAVSACKNGSKAAEECTECTEECCGKCENDSTCCKAACQDSTVVVEAVEAVEAEAPKAE